MIYLLLSSFFYSVNNLLWKQGIQRFQEHSSSLLSLIWGRSVFTSLIGLIVLSTYDKPIHLVTEAWRKDGLLYILASCLGAIGLYSMLRGLKRSGLLYFSLFQALITFISGLAVFLLYGITPQSFLGVFLILAGYMLHIWSGKHDNARHDTLWFIIMVAAFTALGFVNWRLVKSNPVIIAVTVQELFIFVCASIASVLYKYPVFKPLKENYIHFLLFAAVIFLAVYVGDLGLKFTDPFVYSIIGLIVPLMTALLGVYFLREKWTWTYMGCLGLIIIGVYLITN
jgi:drug/metabolite transporter (DMT)-like permease